ncbi:fatty acid transporter [Candidimonas sp. SYP-B2681]|uniref:OmpP1/FadL family transporter n=1 Tax=Candidimonas sp. SYP-B2681 TaxID=2497686 RepID=UPI000F88BD57|nr:outer membrane protein transport protein [Candidimonas sp. SYP-B2681]RTZ45341.1 fatty acid transporter [Candidimonas sp. SYP-B2681]
MKAVLSLRVISAVVVGLGSASVHAAGFQLLEQNASGIGNSYAGSAAIAENASTIYFNPAGMTRLKGVNVSGGVSAVRPSFKFSNTASTVPGGVDGNGGDAGSWGLIPNAYASWEITPQWYVGLGIGAPFGLKTEYDDTWTGRYHSKMFSIETINVNPSIAYKVNDQLSLGAGINWMRLDAEFSRAAPVVVPGLGFAGDLDATVKMDGDAWGWNLGLLYQLTPETRIGLAYRSKVKIDLDGKTRVSNSSVRGRAAALVPPMNANADTSVELPDTAILSVVHDLNSQWQLLADVSWTGWSSIRSLDINNTGNPRVPSDSQDLRFRDTWRIALGANYKLTHQWTLKGGVAWDQSPVHKDKYRPTALPDNDRYWLSVGARYHFNERTTLDIGYAHLFVKDTSIANDTAAATKGIVRGDYDSDANVLGIQVSHRF